MVAAVLPSLSLAGESGSGLPSLELLADSGASACRIIAEGSFLSFSKGGAETVGLEVAMDLTPIGFHACEMKVLMSLLW